MDTGINPNIPVTGLSKVALPSQEEAFLFYDSENNFSLTSVKNVGGIRIVRTLIETIEFERTFTPLEIKTTGSQPIDLLPAPALNKMYVPNAFNMGMFVDFNTQAFNNNGGLFVTADNAEPFFLFDTDALNTLTGGLFIGYPFLNTKANYAGKKLTLLSPGGDFTDGDSDVTIKFSVSLMEF